MKMSHEIPLYSMNTEAARRGWCTQARRQAVRREWTDRPGCTYHIRHSPKNRLLCVVSELPHGYPRRRPAPLGCSGRSPAAWVLALQGLQPCPPPCSHNNQIQRHRADPHLQKEGKQNPSNEWFILSNQKAGQGWNEDYPSQWSHMRWLYQRNTKDKLWKSGVVCI